MTVLPTTRRDVAVWLYVLALLSIAVVASTSVIPGLPQPPRVIPWWFLALASATAESFVFRMRFGRESADISPSEVVLAVGLVFADPLGLVLARVVGVGFVAIRRRERMFLKVLFNLSLMVVETAAALWVFHAVGLDASSTDTAWRAVFVAALAAGVVNQTAVVLLMQLHKRAWAPAEQVFLPLASTLANISLGALAVVVLTADVLAGFLLIAVGGILAFGYQTYDRIREQHDSLSALQELSRAVGKSLGQGQTSRVLLEETRQLLRAQTAEIVLVTADSDPQRLFLGRDVEEVVEEPAAADPIVARVAAGGATVLATRTDRRSDVVDFLAARGLRDAIVAPLRASSTTGVLIVGNRTGEASTFTKRDRQLLQTVAHHASVLLDNGRLVNRLRQEVAVKERQAARLSEQAALLDKARDAITVRDMDHRVTYFNRAAEQLYGWTAEEIIGQRTRELYPDPADYDKATAALLADGEWSGVVTRARASGSELIVESRWTLVRDLAGDARAVLVIDTDVTERTHLEKQLLRAQRMESIGTLAGGIAHDLNNVLTPIMMATDMLKTVDPSETQLTFIDMIATNTERGADVVRQILSFARGVEGQRVALDLDALLHDVEKIANDTFLKTIRVIRDDTVDLWSVVGDPTQIHQVLLNLCVNARDAMPDGGTLRLAVDAVVVDEHYAATNPGASPGPYVCIRVEDDGDGMPPEVLDRIFEPFYTTKAHGQGTGLGLSVSAGIISSHGGFIRVQSQRGRGTSFDVHLPAAIDAAADVQRPRRATLPPGDGELILIVDDEHEIRTILRHSLEAFGYRVLQAADGAHAVQVLTDHADLVDIVLTDMMMPGMDGPATIRALHDIRADLPIIAASGLHSQIDGALNDMGVHHFLPKPYSISNLLHTLRTILGEVA